MPARRSPASPLGRALRRALDGALLSAVAAVTYASVFHLSVVRGASMQPGIHDGDRILVEPFSLLVAPVGRGDVVVLRSPLDPEVDYIKRVVGLPGELVAVRADGVWIDGQRLEEPYAIVDRGTPRVRTRLGPDEFFVLGDNRPQSADSRDFGAIRRDQLRGRVDLRVWPPLRIGLVD